MLSNPILSMVKKYGDFSYGIYLWGFLVQQTLMHLLHLNLMSLMLSSIVLTYVCGAISWHLVEKQALRLKLY
jgi:peptidoglycan/LPS O-acetylase OafA/YrhL